jgi:hypothetical protein
VAPIGSSAIVEPSRWSRRTSRCAPFARTLIERGTGALLIRFLTVTIEMMMTRIVGPNATSARCFPVARQCKRIAERARVYSQRVIAHAAFKTAVQRAQSRRGTT